MGKPNPNLRLLGSNAGGDEKARAGQSEREWLSVSDASKQLEVPERRLRRYVDRHGAVVKTRRTGRKHLIARDALPVLARIRELYEEGATAPDVDTALAAERPAPASRQLAERREGTEALTSAMVTAAAARQLTELQHQVTTLRGRVAELGDALEQRDRVLRRALTAMVDLFQYNENERRLAESERDRDAAHRHQRLMLAVQELLMHARKRRRWW